MLGLKQVTCISRCKYCTCFPDHMALYFHFYRHEQHHVRFYFLRVYWYLHTNSCYIIIIISSKVWKSVNPNVIFLYFLKYLIVKRSSSLKKKMQFLYKVIQKRQKSKFQTCFLNLVHSSWVKVSAFAITGTILT